MTCFKKAITETYAELQVRKNYLHYSNRLLQILKVYYIVCPSSQDSSAASGPVQLHFTN